MDWFKQLTGFTELTGTGGYGETRERLELDGRYLVSRVNGKRFGIGRLELVSLATLREQARLLRASEGALRVANVVGDVRALHSDPEFAGALFQVASQFNLLEMVGSHVSPEDGVTCYQGDGTQGPACAIAAGAATIFRNYFAPVPAPDGLRSGQTRDFQLDGLADLGSALGRALNRPVTELWTMKNGYALCEEDGLHAIGQYIEGLDESGRDALRGRLRIGMHWDVEVTDGGSGAQVSQAFCSALPVAYMDWAPALWRPFAKLVLEGAYEATLLAGKINAAREGTSNTVLLTHLGGGAFGNEDEWIDAAMRRALEGVRDSRLDVRLVSYRHVRPASKALAAAFR